MNYTLGIIAAFCTLACWTVGTFAFTQASKNAVPLVVNRVRLLFACIILTVIVFINVPANDLIPPTEQWTWLGISGIIGLTVGDYFAFNAFKFIGSSKASLFSTFAPAGALILGIVLLGETINLTGIIGMAISLAGITWFVWSNAKRNSSDSRAENKGILFAILGALCQGIGLVFAKKGMNIHYIHPFHATWMRMLMAAGITYLIGAFRTNLVAEMKAILNNKKALYPMLLGTVFGPVAGVSFSLLAAQNLEVSIAQTIFSMMPLSVISVAAISGREKVTLISVIAALVSILGVIILVWRNELSF